MKFILSFSLLLVMVSCSNNTATQLNTAFESGDYQQVLELAQKISGNDLNLKVRQQIALAHYRISDVLRVGEDTVDPTLSEKALDYAVEDTNTNELINNLASVTRSLLE